MCLRKLGDQLIQWGGPMEQGRSAWLSSIIIDHHQEMKVFKLAAQAELDERLSLINKLRDMTASRDKLQAIVLEASES